ncbi:MAG TPA: MipA/OmpV family protein [Burkholderiales bacterium]|nr:MipA/OmpV family protein [Burkholderiales bacterium]
MQTACAGLAATLLAVLSLPALVPAPARAEQLPLWEAGAGITIIDFPEYRGSAERRTWVLPFPYLIYRGEFLKADERRVRGLFFKTDRVELDTSVNGTVPVKSSENAARQGMPDLDPTLEIGPSINFSLLRSADRKSTLELRLPVRAVFASDFSYVDFVGWVFQPTLNVDFRDALGFPGWNLGLLGGPVYSDGRYNRYFYAVDPAFATSSRPAYSPGGGFGGVQFIAALSKRYREFWIGGFAKWDTLSGAAFADSPLVTARQAISAGIAVAWVIGESKTRVETNSGH